MKVALKFRVIAVPEEGEYLCIGPAKDGYLTMTSSEEAEQLLKS